MIVKPLLENQVLHEGAYVLNHFHTESEGRMSKVESSLWIHPSTNNGFLTLEMSDN